MDELVETIDTRGVMTLTLNRVDSHNALNEELIHRLTKTLRRLDAEADVRIVILAANGPTFCAGGDIDRMRRMGDAAWDDNTADARALGELLRVLDGLSKPTIALVRGSAYGGGVGLIACCDVAIAAERARFSLSEVRLGIIPAVIGPFLVRAIGVRQARHLVLTGETIAAQEAQRIGLIHEIATQEALASVSERLIASLLAGAASAQKEAKALVAFCGSRAIDEAMLEECARRLSERRASPDGREGLRAFLEKRCPSWRADDSA